MKHAWILAMTALALSACADDKKDYGASLKCQDMGYAVGTKDYDKCVHDERTDRMLREQRQEYDRMKQDEQDWKMRRY